MGSTPIRDMVRFGLYCTSTQSIFHVFTDKSIAMFLLSSTENYFAGRTGKLGTYSSYYLLGYREGYVVGRLSSFNDLVVRVARLLTFGSASKLEFWVLAWSARTLPILA